MWQRLKRLRSNRHTCGGSLRPRNVYFVLGFLAINLCFFSMTVWDVHQTVQRYIVTNLWPQNHLLAVAVMSAPENTDRRDSIRKTWKNGYEEGREHYVKFVVGMKYISGELAQRLQRENIEHKDLILLPDIQDSYGSLPDKVLAMMVWFDRNVLYSYLLKTDDDTYVMLDRLEDELQSRDQSRGLYWGYFFPDKAPLREGKWAELNWKLCDKYFPYATGGGYILSADVIHRIASNAEALIVYNNEDVSVGAWTVVYDIERKHDVRFNTGIYSRGCLNTFMIIHISTEVVERMELTDERYRKSRELCELENVTKEYEYDWTKLPSDAYVWTKNEDSSLLAKNRL